MLHEKVLRVILSYKRRLTRRLKKRSPLDRLKRRTYYNKNKRKIALRRSRYLLRTKPFLKTRKLFKRQKPTWMTRKKNINKAPKQKVIRPKKHVPITRSPVQKPHKQKVIRPHKVHAPKRT